jgi:acetylglutamate kinase
MTLGGSGSTPSGAFGATSPARGEEIDVNDRAQVLVEALPYIKRFHGQVVVVKVGGNAIDRRKEETLLDIVLLRYVGMLPVLVHGGGPEITALSDRLGLKSEFRNGLRVTDAATMDVVKMVLTGKVNPDIVATLNRLGGQSVGMSGEDGPSIIAERLDEDLGFVGRVTQINAEPITALLERGYIPVLASVGLGYDGQAYNINADTVAAEIAVALGAAKLILMTDVPGILDTRGEVVNELNRESAARLITEGVVSGGMIPKLEACLRALDAVPQAHVVDGRVPHSLLLELFTETGIGTMVTA